MKLFGKDGITERLDVLEEVIRNKDKYNEEVYQGYLDEYRDLTELKEKRRTADGKGQKKTIDPNQLISAGVGILGVMMMLEYEKADVITTKSMSLVSRLLK